MSQPASWTDLTSSEAVTVRWESDPEPGTLALWDQLVEDSAGSDITQLSAWSRIRAHAGFSPLYLFAFDADGLAGGCLAQRRRLFGVLPVCYVPYGPVIGRSGDRAQVVAALAEELSRLARSSAMTFIQPPEGADDVTSQLLANGFRRSDAGIAPAGSYRIDLHQSLEKIRGGFSKRLKSWTNRWADKGVTVRRGDDADLPVLAELMAGTAARQGFTAPPLTQLKTLYTELAPAGHAALFVGEVHGDPVAVDLVSMLGETVHGRRCGFDSSGEAGRLSVPAAVRWEIIKWAKNEGYHWLDFGGLPERMLEDMLDREIAFSDEWPNAHCAKLAFNGMPFRYPEAVELLRPFPIRWSYDLARRNTQGRHLITRIKAALRVAR